MSGITQVMGTFPFVSGLTSEDDGAGHSSSFSLQINTNGFTCDACGSAADPVQCSCVQQFLFLNPSYASGVRSSYIKMQYWMVGYNRDCPDLTWAKSGVSCFKDAADQKFVQSQPFSNLGQIILWGGTMVSGSDYSDYVVVRTPDGVASAMAAESQFQFNLNENWSDADFNVFGRDGGAPLASFNAGARIDVHTSVWNGTADRATCSPINGPHTTETNNLTLAGTCCPFGGHPAILYGGQTSGIEFAQSNPQLAAADLPYCVSRSLDLGGSFPSDIPGTAQDIGVGGETAWIVDSNTYIQKYIRSGNTWQNSGQSSAKRIAVQPDGVPWYVDTNGGIFRGSSNDPATISWTQLGGCAKDIGIGGNGDVWVVGCTAVNGGYDLHKWNGSVFVTDTSGGGATRIAVDSAGTPWIVNSSSEIFQRTSTDPTLGSWHIYGGGAQAVDIGIGPAGYPWIIGTSSTSGGYSIFGWDDVNNTWKPVWGGATQISVGSNGRPWLVNDAGHVFRAATQ